MSMFGSDFFKIIQFALAIVRLFGRIFGDDEDKANDKKAAENCSTEIDRVNQ